MDTREIETSLRGKLGSFIRYEGIFSSDKIPYFLTIGKPIMFIANTLTSKTDVSTVGHWVCFYISVYPKKHILFFDSYGLSPHFYSKGFTRWLEHYSNFQVQEFGRQIQPDSSQKCGLYVVQCIHYISHFGLEKYKLFFQKNFSKNHLHRNDRLVTKYYFKHVLKKKNCSQWKNRRGKHAITYNDCLSSQR